MSEQISVIMPAYGAEPTIAEAVGSVLSQTFVGWTLLVISDDGTDYGAFLAGKGISDPRIRHMSSGMVRGGASRARNLAFERVTTPYVAVLDADDRFKPRKLERVVKALGEHAIVSSALEVMSEGYAPLRLVGAGADRVLAASEHKWVNFSMDSMVAWDRRRTDARYDLDLPNMTDLDLLLRLYKNVESSYHIGEPLHDYVKLKVSMSNGPGVTERMIRAKSLLLKRLAEGYYPMADANGRAGMEQFLNISLRAEQTFDKAMAERPGLLFEDHLEPRLAEAMAQA